MCLGRSGSKSGAVWSQQSEPEENATCNHIGALPLVGAVSANCIAIESSITLLPHPRQGKNLLLFETLYANSTLPVLIIGYSPSRLLKELP